MLQQQPHRVIVLTTL